MTGKPSHSVRPPSGSWLSKTVPDCLLFFKTRLSTLPFSTKSGSRSTVPDVLDTCWPDKTVLDHHNAAHPHIHKQLKAPTQIQRAKRDGNKLLLIQCSINFEAPEAKILCYLIASTAPCCENPASVVSAHCECRPATENMLRYTLSLVP